jgi:hypothetical protein
VRQQVVFKDHETGEVLETWQNSEKWVPVGEQILINHSRPCMVIRVVHSQFYITEYVEELH